MDALSLFFVVAMALASLLTLCYLDARYGLKLIDWFAGKVNNPFDRSFIVNRPSSVKITEDQTTIAELKERIEVLEKIVTEPAYELNQKLNKL